MEDFNNNKFNNYDELIHKVQNRQYYKYDCIYPLLEVFPYNYLHILFLGIYHNSFGMLTSTSSNLTFFGGWNIFFGIETNS